MAVLAWYAGASAIYVKRSPSQCRAAFLRACHLWQYNRRWHLRSARSHVLHGGVAALKHPVPQVTSRPRACTARTALTARTARTACTACTTRASLAGTSIVRANLSCTCVYLSCTATLHVRLPCMYVYLACTSAVHVRLPYMHVYLARTSTAQAAAVQAMHVGVVFSPCRVNGRRALSVQMYTSDIYIYIYTHTRYILVLHTRGPFDYIPTVNPHTKVLYGNFVVTSESRLALSVQSYKSMHALRTMEVLDT